MYKDGRCGQGERKDDQELGCYLADDSPGERWVVGQMCGEIPSVLIWKTDLGTEDEAQKP